MPKEKTKNKRIFILIAAFIIVALILILFFNQNIRNLNEPPYEGKLVQLKVIKYPDFDITKKVFFGENGERIEEYSSDSKKQFVLFFIAPKTLVSEYVDLAIEGDFSPKIIKSDPVVLFTPKDSTTGKKVLKVKFTPNDQNQTSVAFAFNLADYKSLSSENKELFEEKITEVASLSEENFTFNESTKIMQKYAQSLMDQNFLGTESEKGIFFADASFSPSSFTRAIFGLNKIINESKQTTLPQDPELDQASGAQVIIQFKEKINVPKEIKLYVSSEFLNDEMIFWFQSPPVKNESEYESLNFPKILINGAFASSFSSSINSIQSIDGNIFEARLMVSLDEKDYSILPFGESEHELLIDFGQLFTQKQRIIVKLVKGECEQKAGEAVRNAKAIDNSFDLNAEKKIVMQCYYEKLVKSKEKTFSYLTQAANNRENYLAIIEKKIDADARVPNFTNETAAVSIRNYSANHYGESGEEYWKKAQIYYSHSARDLAYLRALKSLTIQKNFEETYCGEIIKNPFAPKLIVPIPAVSIEYVDDPRLLKSYSFARVMDDANLLLDFYLNVCFAMGEIKKARENFSRIMPLIEEIKMTGRDLNENPVFAAKAFEAMAEVDLFDKKIYSIFAADKLSQASIASKIQVCDFCLIEEKTNIPKDWNLEPINDVRKGVLWAKNKILEKENLIIENYGKYSNFFAQKNDLTARLSKHFELMQITANNERLLSQNPNELYYELNFIKYEKQVAENISPISAKPEFLESAKKASRWKIKHLLISHFLSETNELIEALNLLNKGIEEIAYDETKLYQLLYHPYQVGEIIGSEYLNNPDFSEEEKDRLRDFQSKITLELESLKILQKLALNQFELDLNSNNSGLNLFDSIKKNSKRSNQKHFENKVFLKYYSLEIKLSQFDTNASDASLKNCLLEEAKKTYDVAVGYSDNEIYPLARIILADIVSSTKTQAVSQETVNKAKAKLEEIKPKLTLFEKSSDWVKSNIFGKNQTPLEKELEMAGVDYRTAGSIWSERLDSLTDLRYWLAFEIGSQVLFRPVAVPLYESVAGALNTAAATSGSQTLLVLSRTTVKDVFFGATKMFLTKETRQTIGREVFNLLNKVSYLIETQNPRVFEKRILSRIYMENPTIARILGLQLETSEKAITESLVLGGKPLTVEFVQKQLVVGNILPKTGAWRELEGEVVISAAKNVATARGGKTIEYVIGGQKVFIGGLTDSAGQKYAVVSIESLNPATKGVENFSRVFALEEKIAGTKSAASILEELAKRAGSIEEEKALAALKTLSGVTDTPKINFLSKEDLTGLLLNDAKLVPTRAGLVDLGGVGFVEVFVVGETEFNKNLVMTMKSIRGKIPLGRENLLRTKPVTHQLVVDFLKVIGPENSANIKQIVIAKEVTNGVFSKETIGIKCSKCGFFVDGVDAGRIVELKSGAKGVEFVDLTGSKTSFNEIGSIEVLGKRGMLEKIQKANILVAERQRVDLLVGESKPFAIVAPIEGEQKVLLFDPDIIELDIVPPVDFEAPQMPTGAGVNSVDYVSQINTATMEELLSGKAHIAVYHSYNSKVYPTTINDLDIVEEAGMRYVLFYRGVKLEKEAFDEFLESANHTFNLTEKKPVDNEILNYIMAEVDNSSTGAHVEAFHTTITRKTSEDFMKSAESGGIVTFRIPLDKFYENRPVFMKDNPGDLMSAIRSGRISGVEAEATFYREIPKEFVYSIEYYSNNSLVKTVFPNK